MTAGHQAVLDDKGTEAFGHLAPYHNHGESRSLGKARTPEVETVSVTVVTFLRGTGCCEASPVREVKAYYGPDGLIAEIDPVTSKLSQSHG